jgi:glutaredoxin
MDNLVILYTMKGCSFCEMMKKQLIDENIEYYERDIDEHESEYDLFVEVTGSDYVPAFMIVEDHESETPKSHLFVPEQHFNEITEGVEIIKKFML